LVRNDYLTPCYSHTHHSQKLLQVLRPCQADGRDTDARADYKNFGSSALHGIVKEILGKCFNASAMSCEIGDGFVEAVAKNNFEWFYVSKPHDKLPAGQHCPSQATIQGEY
jgi:hypothetical protein